MKVVKGLSQKKTIPIIALCDLVDGQEADTFAMMTLKDESTTRSGKPYFRVGFRDAKRELQFPIWNDSVCAADCRENWSPGKFYKLRGVYKDDPVYGPQFEVHRAREVVPEDEQDGFSENLCQPQSGFDTEAMFDQLVELAEGISSGPLAELTVGILQSHRETLLTLPAATHNHHAFAGGYLEHVLSVTRNAVMLGRKYKSEYPALRPALSVDLITAGAILHDIGKVHELSQTPTGAEYTAAGELIGHILLGRDIAREAAAKQAAAGNPVDEETMLCLEHIIVAHQRLPEWGSPKQPMTPEALIVHHADDLDATFQMMLSLLAAETGQHDMTRKRTPHRTRVFRGFHSP